MSNYNLKSIVSNSEQEALKEMIFKRVRDRAQAMNDEVQGSYTKATQNEVMDLARESLTVKRNPFAEKKEDNKQEIGFAKRQVKEIKAQVSQYQANTTNDIKNKEVEFTMEEARANLCNKASFTGALNFLNSQATIALVKNKGQKFEALA